MFDIGGGELLLIIFVILLLFGPKKIPEIARTLGKGMSHLRRAQAEFQRNINDVTTDVERTAGLESNPRPFRRTSTPSLPADNGAESTSVESGSTEPEVQDNKPQPPVIRPADNAVARTPGNTTPPPAEQQADGGER